MQITTSDIADKLGISRGTVSKALNNRGRINEKTKKLVQKAAEEMGYKKLKLRSYVGTNNPANANNTLSIIIRDYQFGGMYWSVFAKSFEEEAARKGYKFMTNIIDAEDETALRLPKSFSGSLPAGIVTIGPINEAYYRRLKSSGIPVVFVDTAHNINDAEVIGDTLFSCNREHVYEMTMHLINKGHKQLGFIGTDISCRSFYQRKEGFYDALKASSLKVIDKYIFGAGAGEPVVGIREWVTSLTVFPTAFVCVNDYYAAIVKSSLNEIGKDVPRDIALCGYDDDPRLSLSYPELTTVDSQVGYMGRRAMQKLLWRIDNPDAPYEVVKITSQIYYRHSTEGYVFN